MLIFKLFPQALGRLRIERTRQSLPHKGAVGDMHKGAKLRRKEVMCELIMEVVSLIVHWESPQRLVSRTATTERPL